MKISEIVNENDLKNIKKTGVYKISYNNSERIYVGSTTQSFYIRWIQHMWEFRNNCHTNPKMMNVVNKYGLSSLNFEIIEVVKENDKILEREQYYIDLYDSYNKGLNCSPSAYNSVGCKRSQETMEKHYYHIVSQYKQNGEYVETYKSMKEAAKDSGTDYVTLSNACNGTTRLANGFQWRKGDNKNNIDAVKRKGEVTIYQYSEDGIYIKEWNCIKEISESYKRPQNSFSVAIKKGRLIENSYWSKEKKEKIKIYIKKTRGFEVEQIKNGNVVKTWKSINKIKYFYKFPYSTFRNKVLNNQKYKGFLWRIKK